jgi:tagatose 1,6-diphosphate aldolase GatY/KbaY
VIASFADLLADARSARRAAAAFTAYDLVTASAVLEAAEARDVGVVLLVSSQSFRRRTGPALVAALRALAAEARVPACVQLDHERDLGRVEAALAAGAGAVMVDGSALGYEDNMALVAAGCRLAARHGAHVEAELGRIEGDEEVAAAARAGALTDAAQAADFMRRTGAHCLAVSIGNAHGVYREPPVLDWARLDAVSAAVPAPLALHGASGIPGADLRRAVRAGIAKVNVNTELRDAWFAVAAGRAPELAAGARLLALHEELGAAIRAVAADKLDALDAVTDPPDQEAPPR